MSLPAYLTYALPPVVGAGIGLFTNWLAIKMLFRPLAERRILGIRVPFTPGILPRERTRISQSLGDTVAVDLLDEATVMARLRSPAFKDAVRQAAMSAGRKALEAKPSDIAASVDSRLSALLKQAALRALSGLASSETFSASVDSGVASALEASRGIALSTLAGDASVERLIAALSGPGGAPRLSMAISDAAFSLLEGAASEGKSISSFAGEARLRAFSETAFDSAYPVLLEGLAGALADKAIVASMEKAGAKIIRRALDRFSSVQRFFIGLGQYDKAILENMPATIADFSDSVNSILKEASTKKALSARVSNAVADFASRPLSEFAFLGDPVSKAEAKASLSDALSEALASVDPGSIAGILRAALADKSVGDALDAFPALAGALGPAISRWAAGLFGDGRADGPTRDSAAGKVAAAFFSAFSGTFRRKAGASPLGEVVAVDIASLESLAEAAAEGLSELAVSESSDLLASMDIRSLVVEKIDSLDMIDVERMILKVVDKELGAITIFGGILGAVIGVFQSLLFLLR
ncbi:MAG: DUF445 family protein [Spirochaetes bacterium]|nr:DUF445 family protein [Spirochaetota bacterium]MBU1080530.1 DUF445 family protein [Spirochaetota bacterium]